jgi:hypothetical protein
MEVEEVDYHQGDLEIIEGGDPKMENIKAIPAAARRLQYEICTTQNRKRKTKRHLLLDG